MPIRSPLVLESDRPKAGAIKRPPLPPAKLLALRLKVHANLLPLEVMLSRMRGVPLPDGTMATNDMFNAALAAARYIHPTLQAIAVQPGAGALTQEARESQKLVRAAMLAELASLARPEPLTIEGDAMSEPEPQPGATPSRGPVPPPPKWE